MITVVQKKTILHPQEFADEQFSKIFNEILQVTSKSKGWVRVPSIFFL